MADLAARLKTELKRWDYQHRWPSGSLTEILDLEGRIQATARQLDPRSPESAIETARRQLDLEELANRLESRASFAMDPTVEPEPVRVRIQHLERKILDLAEKLEPGAPRQAIARARALARRLLASDKAPGSTPQLDRIERQLTETVARLKRLAGMPRPSQNQRVHQILMALRRLARLETEAQQTAVLRARLPHAGHIGRLEASLRRLESPREHLDSALERIFRSPERARQRLAEKYRLNGENATLQQFALNPEVSGRLRGRRLGSLGDSPARRRALVTAQEHVATSRRLLFEREVLEDALRSARSYRDVQARNHELVQAHPSRESLLSDLGRHMRGLESHELTPLLQAGQSKLVDEVKQAETRYLEPLREGAEAFRKLQTRGQGALAGATVQAQAKRIAALYQLAPRHVLLRLTPPQVQGVLVAASVARRAVKTVMKRVAV